tara:strand:- start:1433 stop:1681 length:249 start_codon:yes stop_codon:yes gene_type:complete
MKINWLPKGDRESESINLLLKLEYRFRSKITRLLVEYEDAQEELDYESIYFDFHTDTKSFEISSKTPEPTYSFLRALDHLFK